MANFGRFLTVASVPRGSFARISASSHMVSGSSDRHTDAGTALQATATTGVRTARITAQAMPAPISGRVSPSSACTHRDSAAPCAAHRGKANVNESRLQLCLRSTLGYPHSVSFSVPTTGPMHRSLIVSRHGGGARLVAGAASARAVAYGESGLAAAGTRAVSGSLRVPNGQDKADYGSIASFRGDIGGIVSCRPSSKAERDEGRRVLNALIRIEVEHEA